MKTIENLFETRLRAQRNTDHPEIISAAVRSPGRRQATRTAPRAEAAENSWSILTPLVSPEEVWGPLGGPLIYDFHIFSV